jgi:DNA-binding response OmpR family regulator
MASGNLNLRVSENNIISFVGNLLDGFHFMSKQKELNYIINIKPTKTNTWFDKDFLEKIILNLVSNAIKYTPKKGSVVCNAIVVDNYFHFEIKNSGKGITKQELQKIFNRFYQTDEYQQGTGIGLSLAKNLVELHKGIITVESELEGWTTFKIKIPINKKHFKDFEISQNITNKDLTNKIIEGHTNNYKNKLENNEKPILLLVEDNTEVRTYLSSIFKNTYQILQVKNGKEGINLALEIVPDIIISDIMMPIINGIELCNKLKTEEITSHIPIILLTAKAGDENKLKGIKTRADDYITKPFNEELLKFKIANLLEIRKKLQIRFSQEVILKPFDVAINTADQMFLEKLQMILDKQLIESDFNSEKFCKAVGVSRMQLHRKLKALFNMSTSQFIRTQRLKLAADLLKKSDINISQIGYSVGFNDHAYFSKCFKKMFGCSPLEYSKKK